MQEEEQTVRHDIGKERGKQGKTKEGRKRKREKKGEEIAQ